MTEVLFFLAGAVLSAPVCFGFGLHTGFNRGAHYGFNQAKGQLIAPPTPVKPRPAFFIPPEAIHNTSRYSRPQPNKKG